MSVLEKIMIERINTTSVNNNKQSMNQPRFTGGPMDVVLSAIQSCERNPMVNVAVLDLSTAIVPRTVVESETNPYAGLEAFRREASGLVINCMIPGVIVWGIAQAIQKGVMGDKTTGMGGCWANEETIDLVSKYWKNQESDAAIIGKDGKTIFEKGEKAKTYRTIKQILVDTKGVDGDVTRAFDGMDFDASIKTLTEKVFTQKLTRKDKKAINEAYKAIAEQTHITENIKIGKDAKGYFGQNLESLINETPKILRDLVGGKDVGKFVARAKKLLNAKSIGGLAVIIPLAIAAQPINRWITEKTSGKKGAPIYKDFTQTQSKELSQKEKSALFRQKCISVGAMVGVALLSIMKIPSLSMLKNITQFKGIFPSMDQARIISTATFASRMGASQDKNDLREATFRDIATFSSFYFLGDYVAKGIASAFERHNPDIKLINVLEKADPNANMFKKFWHWAKHTSIKSSHEVVGKSATRMRSYCQLGNIGFSLIALGLVIPKLYRKKTYKEREKELKQRGVDQQTIDKYYPHFMMTDPNFQSRTMTYKAFQSSSK